MLRGKGRWQNSSHCHPITCSAYLICQDAWWGWLKGSVLGQSPQSHWCSVYHVTLSHHSHTAWGKEHFPRTPPALFCLPAPLSFQPHPVFISLLSELSFCPGGCAVIDSTVQICPAAGWSCCLPSGLLEIPRAMLLEAFKHATIRSGLIILYS